MLSMLHGKSDLGKIDPDPDFGVSQSGNRYSRQRRHVRQAAQARRRPSDSFPPLSFTLSSKPHPKPSAVTVELAFHSSEPTVVKEDETTSDERSRTHLWRTLKTRSMVILNEIV